MSVNFKLGLARFGANLAVVDLANFHLNANSSKNLQANSASKNLQANSASANFSANFGKNSQVTSANSAVFANFVLFSMMMHTLVC